jgi:RHS repeat-associated protein
VNPSGANNEQTGATVDQARTYLYDASERLVEVKTSNNQTVATYRYDPFGRRVRKTVNIPNTTLTPQNPIAQQAGTTFFGFASEGMIAEFGETGNVKVTYAYTPALASGSHATWQTNPLFKRLPPLQGEGGGGDGVLHAFHTDHLGTPQVLTAITATQTSSTPPTANPSVIGKVTWRAHYESFGEAFIDQTITNATNRANGTSTENNHRFPGQFFDQETGLAQNFNRDYEPQVGRYVQLDPKLVESEEPYTYVSSQPLLDIDPTGEIVPVILGTYGRCVAQCMAFSCVSDFVFEECPQPCLDNLGPCLSSCANPLNWGGPKKLGPKRPKPPPPKCPKDLHNNLHRLQNIACRKSPQDCESRRDCIRYRQMLSTFCYDGKANDNHRQQMANRLIGWPKECGPYPDYRLGNF